MSTVVGLPFRILRAAYTLITLELIAHNALGMLACVMIVLFILQVSFLQKRASVLQEQLDASHIRR